MTTTYDLIDAIRGRDALEITNAFNDLMSERVNTNLDAFRNTLIASVYDKEEDVQEAS